MSNDTEYKPNVPMEILLTSLGTIVLGGGISIVCIVLNSLIA